MVETKEKILDRTTMTWICVASDGDKNKKSKMDLKRKSPE